MQPARAEMTSQRFCSMSTQTEKLEKDYYRVLERTQKGSLNITEWLLWYGDCLKGAIQASEALLSQVISKALFRKTHGSAILNKRQHLMINKLLDDFYGQLTTY
jgi:Fic family protein